MWTARRVRRHLNGALLARAAVAPAWAAAGAFLAWRVLLGAHSLLAGAAGLLLAAAATALQVRRHAWSDAEAAVVLDRAAGAGGLLLAVREVPSDAWEATLAPKLQDVKLPKQPLARPAGLAALALAAFGLALLVPETAAIVPAKHAAGSSRVEALEAKAEVLEKEGALDKAVAEELARLEEEASSGRFDAADWQAADAVDDALAQAASDRADDLARAKDAAESLAGALEAGGDSEALARAEEALDAAMAELASDGGEGQGAEAQQGQGGEPKAGGEKGGDGEAAGKKPGAGAAPRSAAEARALTKQLQDRLAAMQQSFGAGVGQSGKPGTQPGQASGSGKGPRPGQGTGQNGPGSGKGQGQGQGPGNGRGEQSAGKEKGSQPSDGEGTGQGGPGPGGGVAPVTWGEPVGVTDDLLFQPLPETDAREPGELLGLQKKAPTRGQGGDGPSGKGVDKESVAPQAAPLAPRHQQLIKRYFDSTGGTR